MRMVNTTKPQSDHEQVQKTLKCLMCRHEFTSHYIGERVCKKCKDTSVWKSGAAWHE